MCSLVFDVWLQAVELNCIVADMFKTAYICGQHRSRQNGLADWQSRHQDEDVVRFPTPDTDLRQSSSAQVQCSSECHSRGLGLRPPSSVSSISSSSDSATEVVGVSCGVGDGLGSISSITESVNSWSFRFPEMPSSSASEANDRVVQGENSTTLLIDNRRQPETIATLTNTTGNCSPRNIQVQVRHDSLLMYLIIPNQALSFKQPLKVKKS